MDYRTDSELYPASLVGRFFANIIDLFCAGLLLFLFGLLYDVAIAYSESELARSLMNIIGFAGYAAIPILYFAAMESSKLQPTLGKYITGIKVVNSKTYQRISFVRALGRSMVKVGSFYVCAIFVLLFFFIFSKEKKQAFHDELFETWVVDAEL